MTPETETRSAAASSIRPRRAFWITFVLAFALLAGWSVASPHMASPDEPAHAAKAAATVRGQFFADESQYNPGRGTFEIPALFQQAWSQTCYAFQPNTPASCAPMIGGDLDETTSVASHVARYNPVYYALIGLPTLFPLSEFTFTAMRLVSALVNALLIALTFMVLTQLRRPRLPMIGVLAAATPMTIFIGSSMTPQGPEVFGALLVTVTLATLVFEPDERSMRSRGWILFVGTAFFVLARGLSPLYLALIIVFVIAAAPSFRTIAAIVQDRRFWAPLGACVGISVIGLAYTLLSGSLALGVVYPDASLTARDVVVTMVRNTDYYLEQILGTFGWGDTHVSLWVLILVSGTALFIGILAVAFSGWRSRTVLLLIVAVSLALPIALQVASFRESGLVWQGKYILPLAMAAPVLAGFMAAGSTMSDRLSGALLRTVAAVVAFAQLAALTANLHRYVNGADGPWLELVPNAWAPLVPIGVILVGSAAVWVIVVLAVRRFSLEPAPRTAAVHATGSSAG